MDFVTSCTVDWWSNAADGSLHRVHMKVDVIYGSTGEEYIFGWMKNTILKGSIILCGICEFVIFL